MTITDSDTVLLIGDDNTYLRSLERSELHFAEGLLQTRDIIGAEYGTTIETNTGATFTVIHPSIRDLQRHGMERKAQIITPKDAGSIIAETGVSADSTVVEAGTGSAFLTTTLGNLVGHVYTYEKRGDFIAAAKANIAAAGLDNVTLQQRDVVAEGFDESDADLVVLDMKHVAAAVPQAVNALAPGGHLVCYCPVIEQVQECVTAIRDSPLQLEQVVETIKRGWNVNPTRPSSNEIPHTAFLVFARNL